MFSSSLSANCLPFQVTLIYRLDNVPNICFILCSCRISGLSSSQEFEVSLSSYACVSHQEFIKMYFILIDFRQSCALNFSSFFLAHKKLLNLFFLSRQLGVMMHARHYIYFYLIFNFKLFINFLGCDKFHHIHCNILFSYL